jgi:hypothetical protein
LVKADLTYFEDEDPDLRLLLSGGFACYDEDDRVVGVMAMTHHPTSSSLPFNPPEPLTEADVNR